MKDQWYQPHHQAINQSWKAFVFWHLLSFSFRQPVQLVFFSDVNAYLQRFEILGENNIPLSTFTTDRQEYEYYLHAVISSLMCFLINNHIDSGIRLHADPSWDKQHPHSPQYTSL